VKIIELGLRNATDVYFCLTASTIKESTDLMYFSLFILRSVRHEVIWG